MGRKWLAGQEVEVEAEAEAEEHLHHADSGPGKARARLMDQGKLEVGEGLQSRRGKSTF